MKALEQSTSEEKMKDILKIENLIGNLDIPSENGSKLMHLAASDNSARVVTFLLKQEAKPSAINASGLLPVHCTVNSDAVEVVQVFHRHNPAILNKKIFDRNFESRLDQDKGASLIHLAVWKSAVQIIDYLVQVKPDCVNELCYFDEFDARGSSVIHLACDWLDVIGTAYYLPKTEKDESQRDYAEQKKTTIKMIKLFLKTCSKDILITAESGTVLPRIISLQDVELIKTIFEDRFKDETDFLEELANKLDKKGVAPVEVAVRMPNDPGKSEHILSLLLRHGAEIYPAYEAVMQVSDIKLLKILLNASRLKERERKDLVKK